MSVHPSNPHSSRNPRKRSRSAVTEPAETYSSINYQDLSLAGPDSQNHPRLHTPYRHASVGYVGPDLSEHLDSTTSYLTQDSYQQTTIQPTKLHPAGVTGSAHGHPELYPDTVDYFHRDDPAHAMMMSQRDMGYGYMAAPMQNPLQSYSSGPSYPSSLAALPGYYSDPPQHQRSYSGSSRPSSSLPVVDFSPLGAAGSGEENEGSLQSRKRRRTSQLDARRLNKMRVRRNQLPSILDLGGKAGTDFSSGPVDIYPAASAPPTYVHHDRLPITPPTFRNDYNDTPPPGHPNYVSPAYHQPSYSMGPINPSTLAPPTQGYTAGRSSPLLQAPLPPGPAVSQHVEPVVVGGGREKPQCWDHGCNGREFSTFSNLLRHQREKSGSAAKSYCPHCGAEFTRTTARNGHMEHGKCKTRKTSDTSVGGTQPR